MQYLHASWAWDIPQNEDPYVVGLAESVWREVQGLVDVLRTLAALAFAYMRDTLYRDPLGIAHWLIVPVSESLRRMMFRIHIDDRRKTVMVVRATPCLLM